MGETLDHDPIFQALVKDILSLARSFEAGGRSSGAHCLAICVRRVNEQLGETAARAVVQAAKGDEVVSAACRRFVQNVKSGSKWETAFDDLIERKKLTALGGQQRISQLNSDYRFLDRLSEKVWRDRAASEAVRQNKLVLLALDPPGEPPADTVAGAMPAVPSPREAGITAPPRVVSFQARVGAPLPWGETNHSKCEIGLEPVDETIDLLVRKTVLRFFSSHSKQISEVRKIAEGSSSENYRVIFGDAPPLLFRMHGRLYGDAVQVVRRLGEFFLRNGVLPKSPVRGAIVPLRASIKRPTVQRDGVVPFRDVAAYPYVEGAEHFSGTSDEELASVATEFARFQRALAKADHAGLDLGALRECVADLSFSSSHPGHQYKKLRPEYSKGVVVANNSQTPHSLMEKSDAILAHAVARLAPAEYLWKSRNKKAQCAAYIDFHPHNTLVKNGTCVLIYDFEGCLPQINQQASLAFALHRFTRERVLKQGPVTKKNVGAARDIFLSAYRAAGAEVPDDFTARLPALIRWMNLHKLFFCYRVALHDQSDLIPREPDVVLREMRKFLMYVQEADDYEDGDC